jgi:hypothetical protein
VNLKSKVLLLALLLVPCSQIFSDDLADFDVDEQGLPLDEATRSRHVKKWLRIRNNLTVGGNETVGGSLTVDGGLTTNSITISPATAVGTPGVAGIGGLLAWGEVGAVAGTTPPVATQNFTFSYASSTANPAAMFGMTPTLTPMATAGLTLTNAGVYLIQYQASNATEQTTVTTIQLLSNTVAIPNSEISLIPGTTTAVELNGFIICYQPAGALIQLQLVAAAGYSYPAVGIGAKLTVTRIS